jgi:predicted PurR-regulated permease PerM
MGAALSDQPDSGPPSREESSSYGDRPFFKVTILVFLAFLTYLLLPSISLVSIGGSIVLLLFLSHRGARFELGVGLVFFVLIFAFVFNEVAGMLWPFVFSFVLGYLLEPLVGVLVRYMPRSLAIGVIAALLLGTLTAIGALLIPLVISEVWDLVRRLPDYAGYFRDLYGRIEEYLSVYGYEGYASEIQQRVISKLPEVGKLFADQTTSALQGLTSGIAAFLNLLMIPFLTYYILKDFARIKSVLADVFPERHRERILDFIGSVDAVLGQYIRGQIIVSTFVAVLTAIGLSLSGVRYAVVLGLTAGALNLIPYVGIGLTFLISLFVAAVDVEPWIKCVKVLVVFVIVQGVEGNFLSPRVVGKKVGLHPAWVIFALVISANLWGFLGMLIAIPVAAVVNIVIRLITTRYFDSVYYRAGE